MNTSQPVPQATKPRRSRRRRIGFSLVIAVFFLGCLELGFRIFWERPPTTVGDPFILNRVLIPDPDCGWRMKPGVEMDYELYAGVRFSFRTNSAGFRCRERKATAKTDRTRVVVIGDSFAFGWGVQDRETFPWQLEEILPDTEVFNLGVSGYNVAQSHRMLIKDGLRRKPDVVVFAFYPNDVMMQEIPDMAKLRAAAERRRSGERSFKMMLAESSHLIGFLRHSASTVRPLRRACQALGLKEPDAGYEGLDEIIRPELREYPESLQKEWDDTIRELGALHETCRRAGTKLLLLSIPSRQALDSAELERTLAYVKFDASDFDMRKCTRGIEAVSKERGIAFLDGTRALEAPDDRYWIYFDMHLNAAGHRALADALRPVLLGLLADK